MKVPLFTIIGAPLPHRTEIVAPIAQRCVFNLSFEHKDVSAKLVQAHHANCRKQDLAKTRRQAEINQSARETGSGHSASRYIEFT